MSCDRSVHLWVDSRCHLAESPRWDDRRDELIWVDLEVGDLWRCSKTDRPRRIGLGRATGVAVPREDGGYLTAGPRGFMWIDDDGTLLRIVDIPGEDWSLMRMNDGACDPAGRLLCGSTSWESGAATGRLYSLDADGRVRVLLDGLGMSNGVGWSPDGGTFYQVDSLTQTVTVFDYDVASGSLGNPRPFATIEPDDGVPDGLAVDADGGVWLALWGGGRVLRYTADGDPIGSIKVPARYVTACAFGGSDLNELYITTARWTTPADQLADQPGAGGVFRCHLPVTGQPLRRFASRTPKLATTRLSPPISGSTETERP